MRILSYEYSELAPGGWSFDKVELGKTNLVVGDTGSGKTRFLNTIFNLGSTVTGKRSLPGPCQWRLRFGHKEHIYDWHISTDKLPDGSTVVSRETLSQLTEFSPKIIVSRSQSSFRFLSKTLPKLRSDNLSITILKEETVMQPLLEAFSLILRRNFFSDALEAIMPISVSQPKVLDTPPKSSNDISIIGLPVNVKLHLLSKYFPLSYKRICDYFTTVFPLVTSVDIKDLKELGLGFRPPGPTPICAVKERNVKTWIGVDQLSTGMQKVLLILTDIFTLPDESIYLIDEYENSLGVSAIDFLPPLLGDYETNIQFIVTSHHPYLINSIPVENWIVFHRRGSRIKTRYGSKNIEAYGKSKQQRFIQLLNDPFYTQGID